VDSEVQAGLLGTILTERGIPHIMQTYHDSAYDGFSRRRKGGARFWRLPDLARKLRGCLRRSNLSRSLEPANEWTCTPETMSSATYLTRILSTCWSTLELVVFHPGPELAEDFCQGLWGEVSVEAARVGEHPDERA